MRILRFARRSPQPTRERGQALVEFALVSLAFFMLVFGIVDGTRLYESWVTLQHAAREGARYAITGQVKCDGVTDDRDACIVQKAMGATEGLSGGGADGTEVAVSFVHWEYPDYSDPPQSGSGAACDAIEVRVTYTHKFSFPVLKAIVPSGVTMTGSQRMVNEPFGVCGQASAAPAGGDGGSPPGGPLDTPTPGATPTNTAVPTATNTAVPTPTNTPLPPTATSTPVPPTATSTPGCSYWWCAPTPTPTPSGCSYWWCH